MFQPTLSMSPFPMMTPNMYPQMGGMPGFGGPMGGGCGCMGGGGVDPRVSMLNQMYMLSGMLNMLGQMMQMMSGMPGMGGFPGMGGGMPGMGGGFPGMGGGMPGMGGGFPGMGGGMPGMGGGFPGMGGGMPGMGGGFPGMGGGMPGMGGMPPTNYQMGGPVSANVERLAATLPPSRQNAARQHFPNILQECQRQGVTDRAQIAYILATAVHESGAGAHMEEFASGSAYEGRRSLGNTQPGDGVRFKGRGYVQVTGRRNYSDWSRRLGVDLVSNPRLASQPNVAARILVQGMRDGTFTGRRLGDYVGNGRADFAGARRVVNGNDRAGQIGQIAQRLLSAM